MLKRLMTALLAIFCLTALPLTALAEESFRVTVTVPYFQVWKTDVPEADDRFIYRWTAAEDAPVPEGVTTSYWDWELAGNTEGKLSLAFQFDEPGTYQYRLAAFVPNPKPGYVYETRTYLLTVLVQNTSGGLQAEWYILNEDSDEKVDLVELDPSYTAGKRDDESESRPGKPTDDTSGSRQGSSAGGSSASEKSDESGTGTGIGKVRTGDDTVIRSWAAILSVSGLMVLYLICQEVREGREKNKKDG